MTEDIKIRACGKSELALLYFPTANGSQPPDGVGEENTRVGGGTAETGLSQDRQVFHRPRGAAHRGLPRLSITGGG